MKSLLKQVGLKPYIAAAYNYKSRLQWNHQLHQWLRAQAISGSQIHSSIALTGIKPPFDLIDIGSKCIIDQDVTIWLSGDEGAEPNISIRHNAYIGRNSFFAVYHPITIGAFAQIAAYCYIVGANHGYSRRDIPIMEQGLVGGPISICDDAWLGTHVVVMPGVTIGKGAIVAAGAVVTKDIPPYEVWGGVPAKFLKDRP